jgi:DNA polymerase-3 subunit gamma/tau
MRDALSLTDQAIAYAAGAVTLDAVQGMLGALDQSYLIRLLDALAAQDGADLLAVADEMATRSLSYNGACRIWAPAAPDRAGADGAGGRAGRLAGIRRYRAPGRRLRCGRSAAVLPDRCARPQRAGPGAGRICRLLDDLLRMLAFRPGVGGAEGQACGSASSVAPGGDGLGARCRRRAAARAAANVQASHASVVPPSVVAGAAAMAARQAAPAAGHGAAASPGCTGAKRAAGSGCSGARSAPGACCCCAAASGPVSPARAAINAALEAARAASAARPLQFSIRCTSPCTRRRQHR